MYDDIAQQQQESTTNAQQQPAEKHPPPPLPPPPQSDYELFSKAIATILPANRKFASLTQLHQFMKLFMSFWDVPRLGTYSTQPTNRYGSGSYWLSRFFLNPPPPPPIITHTARHLALFFCFHNSPSYIAVAVSILSHPGRTPSPWFAFGLRYLLLFASLFTYIQFTEVVHCHVIIANVL
jgi:hypothetical protein